MCSFFFLFGHLCSHCWGNHVRPLRFSNIMHNYTLSRVCAWYKGSFVLEYLPLYYSRVCLCMWCARVYRCVRVTSSEKEKSSWFGRWEENANESPQRQPDARADGITGERGKAKVRANETLRPSGKLQLLRKIRLFSESPKVRGTRFTHIFCTFDLDLLSCRYGVVYNILIHVYMHIHYIYTLVYIRMEITRSPRSWVVKYFLIFILARGGVRLLFVQKLSTFPA